MKTTKPGTVHAYCHLCEDLTTLTDEVLGQLCAPCRATTAYRKAASRLYKISAADAAEAIVTPANDPGEWSPNSLGILRYEFGTLGRAGDDLDASFALDTAADCGCYVEWINGAVGAIYAN